MKYYFILTLAFLISINIYSQNDSLSVSFVAYWEQGDVYDFKITKIKKQWKNDVLVKNDSSQYIAKFEVIEASDDYYRIKWKFVMDLGSSFNLPDEIKQQLNKKPLTELIYKTSELGEFIEIENWQEISELMTDVFKSLITSFSKNDIKNKEKFEAAMAPFLPMFTTKTGLEQFVFKELNYFHFPFGIVFNSNEVLEYEDEIPNILGKTIKGDSKIFFESVDFENFYCVLIHQSNLNPEDTRAAVIKLFNDMGLKGDELNNALSTFKLDTRDNNRFEYYYNPGVPALIETERVLLIDVENQHSKAIDKTIIELINL